MLASTAPCSFTTVGLSSVLGSCAWQQACASCLRWPTVLAVVATVVIVVLCLTGGGCCCYGDCCGDCGAVYDCCGDCACCTGGNGAV